MSDSQAPAGRLGRFSDYVVYADESGDHSLVPVDTAYPIFVLCLCIFHKRIYTRSIVPRVQNLKFRWFGHDSVVLHERDIRKQIAPFNQNRNKLLKYMFLEDISDLMKNSPFRIAACVIDKLRLQSDLFPDNNPYEIALESCVMSAHSYLREKIKEHEIVHFIFEMRGKKEDRDLELAFRRIIAGENSQRLQMANYEIVFVDKKANSSGMQIADLTARPIGLNSIRPNQENKAFSIINRKLIRSNKSKKIYQSIIMFP